MLYMAGVVDPKHPYYLVFELLDKSREKFEASKEQFVAEAGVI